MIPTRIGRRLFRALTADMNDQDARRVYSDLWYAAAFLGLVLLAWLSAVYFIEVHQTALDSAREEGALSAYAEAKRRAQHEAEALWLPQVMAAYEQGRSDECRRVRRNGPSGCRTEP